SKRDWSSDVCSSDLSLIASDGQDDRVCGYTALRALLDIEGTPARTQMVLLADKEEIGSCGATGMKGAFMRYFVDDLAAPYGIARSEERRVGRARRSR